MMYESSAQLGDFVVVKKINKIKQRTRQLPNSWKTAFTILSIIDDGGVAQPANTYVNGPLC